MHGVVNVGAVVNVIFVTIAAEVVSAQIPDNFVAGIAVATLIASIHDKRQVLSAVAIAGVTPSM